MESELRNFKRRIERDLTLFDFFFVPSSFVRTKLKIEEEIKKKIDNWWYVPILLAEGGRLYGYYKLFLEEYLKL
jgi:hypothetical protein